MRLLKSPKVLVIIIAVILAVIPFFWFKPGEMDLGGDSNRLYFYDPLSFLENVPFYGISPHAGGAVDTSFYSYIPFLAFLIFLKTIFSSPYLLITIFNSIKLVVGFLAVYAIIKEIIRKEKSKPLISEMPAILGGIFYCFSPNMLGDWDKAILSHNQIFLNPLIFYLVLRFLLSKKFTFALIAIIVSFLFAPNFSFISAPPIFSFYPLSFLFLLLYVSFVRKKILPWKGIIYGFILFLGIHAFHLLPTIFSLFDKSSNINSRVLDRSLIAHQLDYFFGILSLAHVSTNLLVIPPLKKFIFTSIVPLLVILTGFMFAKIKAKYREQNIVLALGSIFFLITVYLSSAKITNLGLSFYQLLIYIPGYAMFENFIGQWQFVLSFLEALIFGVALFIIYENIKTVYIKILSVIILFSLIFAASTFINGEMINKVLFQTKDVRIGMVLDDNYVRAMSALKKLPADGKVLVLPFTDCCYQVIHGTNNGAYVGDSTIPYLTGKSDFAGYANIHPFSETFLKIAKEKDYKSIKKMLAFLNIHYIFYNSDEKIYDKTFPGYPYSGVRPYLPQNQAEYKEFIKEIAYKKIFQFGTYYVYSTYPKYSLPSVYAAKGLIVYNDPDEVAKTNSSFFINNDQIFSAYIEKNVCKSTFSLDFCSKDHSFYSPPSVHFAKVNPTEYKIYVSGARNPYMLVFLNNYHNSWRLYTEDRPKSNMKNISSSHLLVNGYANAWYIKPSDLDNKTNYELTLEMTDQRIFHIGIIISTISLVYCIILSIIYMKNWYNKLHS